MEFTYHHVTSHVVWGVQGSSLGQDVVLTDTDVGGCKVIGLLTQSPDHHLRQTDRKLALIDGLLRGGFGLEPEGAEEEFLRRLDVEVSRRQAARAEDRGDKAVLVTTTKGPVDPPAREGEEHPRGDFFYCFGSVDAGDLLKLHRAATTGVAMSLTLALGNTAPVEQVSDGWYLTDATGRVVYVYQAEFGQPRSIQSCGLGTDVVAKARQYVDVLLAQPNLSKVTRLLLRSLDSREDPVVGFVTAWAALEVLVNTTHDAYRTRYTGQSGVPSQPPSSCRVRNLAQKVADKKCKLAEKFEVMGRVLGVHSLPRDVKAFATANRKRNCLVHEGDISDTELPLEKVRALARRYLTIHVEAQHQGTKEC